MLPARGTRVAALLAVVLAFSTGATVAGTITLSPDDPRFWSDYQIVLARVSSVSPYAEDLMATRAYRLKVIETLHGTLAVGTILELSFDPDKPGGPSVPNPAVGRLWVAGVEERPDGNAIPDVILRVSEINLPVELDSAEDKRLAAVRRALSKKE